MWVSLGIAIATCVVMILSALFFPKIRLGKISIDTYWVVTLVGAAVLLACKQVDIASVGKALIADTAVNPLKILALFIAMTVLSIYLDELGFFRHMASVVLRRSRSAQKKLFLSLYIIVSVLTIFTSNDIIILSFTPFICYFAKNAKIDPTPYLAAEFVAANTWSMALIIGNPTNIYLATAFDIDFVEYLEVSILPTVFAGVTAFAALYLMYRKHLSAPIIGEAEDVEIKDKPMLIVGVVHLAVCTVLLAVSSYIGLQMWIVAVVAMGSLCVCALIAAAVRKRKPAELIHCLKRAPYQLVPFMLSMFVIILSLDGAGVTDVIAEFFGEDLTALKYGVASFVAANIVNNIPMSVFFSSVIQKMPISTLQAVFATVIGSNIGAFLTPIGALAGIMWSNILNRQGLKFGYLDFLKMGVFVAVPTLFAAIGGLYLIGAII